MSNSAKIKYRVKMAFLGGSGGSEAVSWQFLYINHKCNCYAKSQCYNYWFCFAQVPAFWILKIGTWDPPPPSFKTRVGPDNGYWNYHAGYPVLSDIQPYFSEVIRSDIRQFSLLYQTKLISNQSIIIRPDNRPNLI